MSLIFLFLKVIITKIINKHSIKYLIIGEIPRYIHRKTFGLLFC